MYKNATYKEKFADLKDWIPYLVDAVKKDLRNEHLKNDLYFVKKFLASKNIHKVTTEELAQAYAKAIQEEEHGEDLAEFITTRWLIKNGDLYEFFEKQLTQINPDFASIEEMTSQQADALTTLATKEFGAPDTYLFSVLNSVVFPKNSFEKLKQQAQHHQVKATDELQKAQAHLTAEQMRNELERETAKLTDKYEKKLAGLQKKYLTDVDALKKQVAALQRKLQNDKGQ